MTNPLALDRAHRVVTEPERFAHLPAILADSWAALKEARGQAVDFTRLGEPAYLVEPATCFPAATKEPAPRNRIIEDLDAARGRLTARIRTHAARIGHTPTGGDAA